MAITLNGLVHGHAHMAALEATATAWRDKTGAEISWRAHEGNSPETAAAWETPGEADLFIFAHQHLGTLLQRNMLQPLDVFGREAERNVLSQESVGPSYESYVLNGRQWAFPLEATAVVTAFRPDLIAAPPADWKAVLELARAGRVALPLAPPHSFLLFLTLCANRGHPTAVAGHTLIEESLGGEVLEMMRELAALADSRSFALQPFEALELLASGGDQLAAVPFGLGIMDFARPGFRPNLLGFADLPVTGSNLHAGAALAGVGIGVGAGSQNADAALEFAYWLASGDTQKGLYARSGGQPAHAWAWQSDEVNAEAGGFYRAIRETLDGSLARPRHAGYAAFEFAAGSRINAALQGQDAAGTVIADLNRLFAASH